VLLLCLRLTNEPFSRGYPCFIFWKTLVLPADSQRNNIRKIHDVRVNLYGVIEVRYAGESSTALIVNALE
jgi:hypothetical protein